MPRWSLQMQAAPEPQLDGAEAKVWKLLSLQEAVSIDTLLAKLPLATSEVYSALLSLEISEYVRQLPGKKYIRQILKKAVVDFSARTTYLDNERRRYGIKKIIGDR